MRHDLLKSFLTIFIYPVFFYVSPVNGTTLSEGVLQDALSRELYKHPVWLTILGYEDKGILSTAVASIYPSDAAFISDNGRTDPVYEMEATLNSFYEVVGEKSDDHPQCRFRARFIWLNTELKLADRGLQPVECEEFEQWKRFDSVESISVMLVGGFLGNPASYYGHNMLKLNSESSSRSDLQNESINFGANIPPADGIFKYILKGITGGYQGVFSSADFFHYANNYGQTEHRDIWEYELDLNDAEISLMLGLMWELIHVDFTYYFFNKNCAYRMAKLFDALRGIELTNSSSLWYSPQTFIQRLTNLSGSKQIFQGNITYHPSRQSAFYAKYYDLDNLERELVTESVTQPGTFENQKFEDIPLPSKLRILDVLLDYYQYTTADGQGNVAAIDNPYNQVLAKRYQLPVGESQFSSSQPDSPHQSRDMSYSAVSRVDNTALGPVTRLRVRPAYYDNLDYGVGHVPAAGLSMVDIDLMLYGGKVAIRNFSLIKIESINLRATGLPRDNRRTWLLEAGVAQDRLDDPKSSVARIRGQIGYAVPTPNDRGVYGLRAGGSIQSRYRGSDYVSATATIFGTYELTRKIRLHLMSEYREGPRQESRLRRIDNLAIRYELAKNFDLRFSYEKNVATEFTLSFGAYW